MSEALRFGVIGQNISYSRSKEIFQALFDRVGMDGQFDIISINPEELELALQRLIAEEVVGLSVTIPFKETILDHLYSIDPIASQVKAVNSVFVDDGDLIGTNTDCFGITESLGASGALDLSATALVLGCGGAARAAVYSLVRNFGITDIVVVGRSEDKLQRFQKVVNEYSREFTVKTATYDSLGLSGLEQFGLVANCTPLGGWNHADKSPLPSGFDWNQTDAYFDMNYNPGNAIVMAAQTAGRTTIDGSAMLVAQAVRSFEIWTGHRVDWRLIHLELF